MANPCAGPKPLAATPSPVRIQPFTGTGKWLNGRDGKSNVMISTKDSFDLAGLFDFLDDVLAWVKDRNGRYLGQPAQAAAKPRVSAAALLDGLKAGISLPKIRR